MTYKSSCYNAGAITQSFILSYEYLSCNFTGVFEEKNSM